VYVCDQLIILSWYAQLSSLLALSQLLRIDQLWNSNISLHYLKRTSALFWVQSTIFNTLKSRKYDISTKIETNNLPNYVNKEMKHLWGYKVGLTIALGELTSEVIRRLRVLSPPTRPHHNTSICQHTKLLTFARKSYWATI
jgi:hypothetical protein